MLEQPSMLFVHPLLVSGDAYAGSIFAALLETVVDKPIWRKNRGFSDSALTEIAAGNKPVAVEAIAQLLLDFYAAYPKRVRDGASEYLLLKSIVDGTWRGTKLRQKKGISSAVPVVSDYLVQEHGLRILTICYASGVFLQTNQRKVLSGESTITRLSHEIVSRLAERIGLPQAVLLGSRNFNRELTPVSNGNSWQSPSGPFVSGDRRASYMWGSLLSNYRSIDRWFRSEYKLTDKLIEKISSGVVGVPIPVHLLLMQKVKERLATIDDPPIPRSYERLLKLYEVIPASYVLARSTETPCKEWFANHL